MPNATASDLIFCSVCGNLLDLPSNDSEFVTCNLCNQPHACHDFEKLEVVTRSRPNAFAKRKIIHDEDETSGAIIDEKCEKCGHGQMKFFTMQLRSADEGQTVFYTCIKCQYTYSLNS